MVGDELGCELVGQGAHLVDADDVIGEAAEVGHQVLVEQRVHDGEQQRRVRSGPGRDVAVGEFGGAGARRVDDRQPAAALAQAP